MLANMIDIHSSADTPLLDWSVPSVSELPTGTVTLLLADVESSTRLWETQSDTMTTALEQLNQTVNDLVAAHVAAADTNPAQAARLLGAADSMRQRHGEVRFKAFQAD